MYMMRAWIYMKIARDLNIKIYGCYIDDEAWYLFKKIMRSRQSEQDTYMKRARELYKDLHLESMRSK